MKAMLSTTPGGPARLARSELPDSVPGPGEVRIAVQAAARAPERSSDRTLRGKFVLTVWLDPILWISKSLKGRVPGSGRGVSAVSQRRMTPVAIGALKGVSMSAPIFASGRSQKGSLPAGYAS